MATQGNSEHGGCTALSKNRTQAHMWNHTTFLDAYKAVHAFLLTKGHTKLAEKLAKDVKELDVKYLEAELPTLEELFTKWRTERQG